MKPIWSKLAEDQTVAVERVSERVSLRRRQYATKPSPQFTNDVMVDGYCYTPAVSNEWLARVDGKGLPGQTNLQVIEGVVARHPHDRHYGYGQWGAA